MGASFFLTLLLQLCELPKIFSLFLEASTKSVDL